ncbi:hypothetical protein DVK02_10740 [Halobellus sp. Atlit-31R]|nr:hypothetical protein DVK02_10740 [Halobellus sp. Atlit-31R]
MRANARTILLVGVVAAVVAGGVAAPASAQAADAGIDSEICPNTAENNLVVVLPDGSTLGPGDRARLYPGTRVDVALCSSGDVELADGVAWSLEPVDGIAIEASRERHYEVSIAEVDADVGVALGSAVPQRETVRAPDLTAASGAVVTLRVANETHRVAVENDSRAETLRRQSERYRSTATELRAAASELAESTGERAGGPAAAGDRLAQAETLDSSHQAVQSILFDAAARGDAGAVDALGAYETDRSETAEAVRTDLQTANDRLAAQTKTAATGALVNLLGFLTVGVAIGSVGGWIATTRILSDVAHRRSRSSSVDYSPRQLASPLFVAALFAVGAVVLGWWFDAFGPLWAVFEAVIDL